LEDLRLNGNLEWIDPKLKRRCHIFWRSPEEWGTLIYAWANDNG
jgi:ESCRT-II complex subunit VPS25